MGIGSIGCKGRFRASLRGEFGGGLGRFLPAGRPSSQRAVAIRPLIGTPYIFAALWIAYVVEKSESARRSLETASSHKPIACSSSILVLQGSHVEIRYWRMGDLADTCRTVKTLGTNVQALLTEAQDDSMRLITVRTVSRTCVEPWSTQGRQRSPLPGS